MDDEKAPIVDLRVVQRVSADALVMSYVIEFRRQGSDAWEEIRVHEVED